MSEFIRKRVEPVLRPTEDILRDVRYIACKEVSRIKKYIMDDKPLTDRDGVHLRSLVQTLVLADAELRAAERHAVTKLQGLSAEEMVELMKTHAGLLEAPKD